MSGPPQPGARISVRVDEGMADDLAILMRTRSETSDGTWTASAAVRYAVEALAQIHGNAWRFGDYPDGVEPRIYMVELVPYDAARHGVRHDSTPIEEEQ